ncbi:MAG: amidase family protein [Mycobacterium sp.]
MHADLDVVELPATRQAQLVRTGEISSVELVRAHLDAIDRLNPKINAIVTLDSDGALRRAAAADAAPADRRGPLHGLPVAIKDTAQTAGMRTTFGHPLFAGNIPAENDEHVERILAAGAVLIGKTNVPEFAAGSHTFNRVFGPTRNPYDLTRSVGGSSGGAAAALAARLVPVADGSDMGGSLRNPASFCGVVGMRPTPGLVPDSAASDAFNPLATSGPLGRTVADVALLLSVIAAPPVSDIYDAQLHTAGLRALRPADLNGIRIAYTADLGGRVPVDPEVSAVIASTAALLEQAGARVEHACPDLDGADSAFRTLRAADFDANWRDLLAAHPDGFIDFLAENIRRGASLSGRDVMTAYAELTRLRQSAARFFGDYDLVLAPVTQIAAFPVEWTWPRSVNGTPMHDYLDWMRSAWLFTPLGIPALSLPAGFTPSGLPVGAQLLAGPGRDLTLLRIASALETALGLPAVNPLGTG